MARVHIDISVFTPHASVGVVNGVMEVAAVPQVGEFITLDSSTKRWEQSGIGGSPPRLEVEHVLPAPAGSSEKFIVVLSDLTLPTREDAKRVVAYLEDGFGVYFNEHGI
jgi:hypothetical protein